MFVIDMSVMASDRDEIIIKNRLKRTLNLFFLVILFNILKGIDSS